MRKASTGNGVSSIKVMANQLRPVNRRLSSLAPESQTNNQFGAFFRVFKDATWIKLTRRDIVTQEISRVMAVQTGIYQAVTDAKENSPCRNVTKQIDPNYNAEVEYSYPAFFE